MKLHQDVEEVLISQEQIVSRCEELGQIITKDYAGKTPVLIGLLKGSVPFMAELIKHIECELVIDFMDVSSYNGVKSTGVVTILKDVRTDVKGRDVIFVEDITDTGLTLDVIIKEFQSRNARSIEIVTLLDKPEGRKVTTINPKYIGFHIPNKFVIGFGLDYNQLYRNLPYVGVLKRSVYEK